ncbi:hypothetical protein BG005_006935 [Podila minutissima]|nr:hypothetical protein BG005_006935 [Podila minutissima]
MNSHIVVLDPDNQVIYGVDDKRDQTKGSAPPDLSLSRTTYNGTKLVLSSGRHTLGWITVVEQQDQVVFTAGGEQIGPTTTVKEEIEYFRDVYVIDQETSVWTRLANGPFRYTNFVAAVAGDHLVLYGSHAGLIRGVFVLFEIQSLV